MNSTNPLTDIHDVAQNIQTLWPERIILTLQIMALLGGIFFIGYIVKWWLRRRKKGVVLSPYAQSMQTLKQLEQASESDDVQYLKLTYLFKKYLNDEQYAHWLEKTVQEIRLECEHTDLNFITPEQKQSVLELFTRSEGVKFAKSKVEGQQFFHDLELVRKTIEELHQKKLAL